MADVKYFCVTTDVFDSRSIKRLRRLPNGSDLVLLWFAFLSIAGKTNEDGLLLISQGIPYEIEEIAEDYKFSIEIVKQGIEEMLKLGMIEINENVICIVNWEKYQQIIGLEKIRENNRNRQAKYRENKKRKAAALKGTDVVEENTDDEDTPPAPKKQKKTDNSEEFFEKIWAIYPRHKNDRKKAVTKTRKKALEKIGFERIEKAIEAYKSKQNPNFYHAGNTFFNEIIDNWIEETEPTPAEQPSRQPRKDWQ